MLRDTSGNLTKRAAERALTFAARRNFSGPDPYDGLTSPLAHVLRAKPLRQAWVQLVKRNGDEFRRVCGIQPVRMTKALALFSMAAMELGDDNLAHDLADQILASTNGGPWGYEFDVQTRWAYYPAGSPNVIATAFVVRALDRIQRTGDISDRTLEWLLSLRQPQGHFAYTPMSGRLIHNGNLLAAEAILRLGADVESILEATQITLNAQAEDGSWAYGTGKDLSWIDNFHTAFVIDSLTFISTKAGIGSVHLKRGIEYWLENLFEHGGLPRYFSTSRAASTDIHNVATAVSTLSNLCREGIEIGNRTSSIEHLVSYQGADGAFRQRPGRPVFMRWNQAHATLALTKWATQ